MNGSINELLASQDDLQVLEDKTDALASQAQRFQRNAHSLQRNQWWKNCKLKVAMCGALLAIITMVALPLALQATHIAADGSGTTTIVLGGTTSSSSRSKNELGTGIPTGVARLATEGTA